MSKVIFESGGLTVTESESLYQITRTSDRVVLATVVKIPINDSYDQPITGAALNERNHGKVEAIARTMVQFGYGRERGL